jgi:hypothetical protein
MKPTWVLCGWEGTVIDLVGLAGSHREMLTRPSRWSLKQHNSRFWRGCSHRRWKGACSTTCTWILKSILLILIGRNSVHPKVQLVLLVAASISMRSSRLIVARICDSYARSFQITTIWEPLSKTPVSVTKPLTRTSISLSGSEYSGWCGSVSAMAATGGGVAEDISAGVVTLTWRVHSLLTSSFRIEGLAASVMVLQLSPIHNTGWPSWTVSTSSSCSNSSHSNTSSSSTDQSTLQVVTPDTLDWQTARVLAACRAAQQE